VTGVPLPSELTGTEGEVKSYLHAIHDSQSPQNPIPSGCGYYRVTLPMDQLAEHGWKVTYQAGTPPPKAETAKILVGQRLDRPDVLGLWRRMSLRHKLVYELDDNIFCIDPINWVAYRVYHQRDVQDAVAHCAEVADMVTVTTEPLAETMREFSDNVVVIPNFIPERMLTMDRPRNERLTIGWTGGASHGNDVRVCAPAVRAFLDWDCPKAQLHVQGTDFRGTFGHLNARHTDWAERPQDYYQLLDFDIGLAPLCDVEFNRSKSYIKALEYAALGIPVIATDMEPYRDFVIDGVTGFLVKKEKEWRDRLRLLANDPDLRETMGAKAREHAAAYTMEKNWVLWDEAYRTLL
jgi:glycosyltransferase involved in cell wall biosynthesis